MKVSEIKNGDFTWIDVANPAKDQLVELAHKHGLPELQAHDCMEPEHLPKYENCGDTHFFIIRALDPDADPDAETLQGLTRKLAVFFRKGFILTTHRSEHPYLRQAIERWQKGPASDADSTFKIAADLILRAARTYEVDVVDCYRRFDAIEEDVFKQNRGIRLESSYFLKRRISLMKRVLHFMHGPLNDLIEEAPPQHELAFRNAKDYIDKLIFQLDEIEDNLSGLLSLQISLISQMTNESAHKSGEVMRVLTIFSVFFLPLNLIAGIYGMNFDKMPGLHHEHGFAISIGLMFGVFVTILLFFRARRLL